MMHKNGNDVHIETDEARGGATPNVVRKVLFSSLLLAIIAMSAIWMTGAYQTAPKDQQPATAEEHALSN